MRELSYLDFDLLVESAGQAGYRARVVESPAGETAPIDFRLPFSELEVENFLLRVGRPRRGPARGEPPRDAAVVRDFGGRLFEAVFHDELRVALATSLDQAEGDDAGLRVRLRLSDCPELVDLPWEYLYDRENRRFLALSEWTPVVRYLQFPGRVRPLSVRPPLRVLVLIASPTDLPPLDVNGERDRLRSALADLEGAGRVMVDEVSTGTLADLQRQLRRADYHVFHYIGHGGYDQQAEDGVLVFEGASGRGQPVSGEDLGMLLHDHRTLRLAVLNSCEGARGGRTDPYSGTAQSLVRQGIPAVVAMQFEITDTAAITFAHNFYEAVADGYPLDAAMAEARKAVRNEPNPVEWGTPVLYLRAHDGRIFELAPSQPTPEDSDAAADLWNDAEYSAALAAFYTQRWITAVDLLEQVSTRYPNHPQVVQQLAHARQQRQEAEWDADASAAAEQAHWSDAVAALEHLLTAHPNDRDVARRLESARAAQWQAEAQANLRRLYAAGEWAAVIAAGEQLAELDPASAGLVTAAEAELADRYTTGRLQLDRGDWVGAAQTFAAIHAERPDYRDVARRLESARAAQWQAEAQANLRRLYAAGEWAAVIAAGEQLAELDPASAGLVTAAKAEAELADRYTTGRLQLDRGDWVGAAQTFAAIHAERPDYRDVGAILARGRVASMGERFLARFIDWMLILLPLIFLVPTSEPTPTGESAPTTFADTLFFLGSLLTLAVYEVVLTARWGNTVGKRLLRLKVVRRLDGGPVGWGPSLLRWVVQLIAWIPGLLFGSIILYLSPFWDSTGGRQGWHDKLAGTIVVKQPPR
ncbi:CHAT domain-containing protein [Kribbella sp. NPDC050281]|uniref:CHAT domain-containing protein n=1 Tax=Kribbella sp. NPDC050281 TaxID=3155515 RepID=UPI0033F577AC